MTRTILIFLTLFPTLSFAQSCEVLFEPVHLANDYTRETILKSQADYLKGLFYVEGRSVKDRVPMMTRASAVMGYNTIAALHYKVTGVVTMSLTDIVLFARGMNFKILDVLKFVTRLQPNPSKGLFVPGIAIGTYASIANDPDLDLRSKIIKAQTQHLRAIISMNTSYIQALPEYRRQEFEAARTNLEYIINQKKDGGDMPLTNALKLADILDLDVRDVLSFLLDFQKANDDAQDLPMRTTFRARRQDFAEKNYPPEKVALRVVGPEQVNLRRKKIVERAYSKEEVLQAQKWYLKSFVKSLGIEQLAQSLGRSVYDVESFFGGRARLSLNFREMILFSRANGISMQNVLQFVTDKQPRKKQLHFKPMITEGSYFNISENESEPLQKRILEAQSIHIKKLINFSSKTTPFSESEIKEMTGLVPADYLENEISYANALKLADALGIDVRNIFSFLYDFEVVPKL